MAHQQAFNDVKRSFDESCGVPLTDDAEVAVERLFDESIGKLLRLGEIRWDEGQEESAAKAFTLSCAAELGAASAELARQGGAPGEEIRVSRQHVVDAATDLLPRWERSPCPLPQVPVDELMNAAASTADPSLEAAVRKAVEISRPDDAMEVRTLPTLLTGCTLLRPVLDRI